MGENFVYLVFEYEAPTKAPHLPTEIIRVFDSEEKAKGQVNGNNACLNKYQKSLESRYEKIILE